jgi:hypothetical protein
MAKLSFGSLEVRCSCHFIPKPRLQKKLQKTERFSFHPNQQDIVEVSQSDDANAFNRQGHLDLHPLLLHLRHHGGRQPFRGCLRIQELEQTRCLRRIPFHWRLGPIRRISGMHVVSGASLYLVQKVVVVLEMIRRKKC